MLILSAGQQATRMDFFRRAFSVLWVAERSPSQPRRAGVVGLYHRRRHLRSSAGDCVRISRPEDWAKVSLSASIPTIATLTELQPPSAFGINQNFDQRIRSRGCDPPTRYS